MKATAPVRECNRFLTLIPELPPDQLRHCPELLVMVQGNCPFAN